ncbi:MAG TPA: RsmG family class I SAM-dependent methyltransferase [Candidatus Krumholzibacteria bacterium]|nr:RsmG family class I SAM-dependent methyltransferase [Candidatus Krumholzibacteria bacterium]
MSATTPQNIVGAAVAASPAFDSRRGLVFVEEILRWNERLGLVSRRDAPAACERLVLESLELLHLVRTRMGARALRVLDVGSGGGFPGVVWALTEPASSLLLVERRAGRATFLDAMVVRLSLANVVVFAGSVEEIAPRDTYRAAFDVAVAIAVAPPDALAPKLEPMLAAGGSFVGTCPADSRPVDRVGKCLEWEGDTQGQYGYYRAYRIPA